MKNDFFKTTFFQNEAILCETNSEAKRCNSFHFSTISFNNFQIKLIILVALFIILIFNTNNSYAYDISDINYDYLNSLTNDEFIDCLSFLDDYFTSYRKPYCVVTQNSSNSNYYIRYYLSPIIYRKYNNSDPCFSFVGCKLNEFYGINEGWGMYTDIRINNSSTPIYISSNSVQQSYELNTSSVQFWAYNSTVVYSNHDIINIEDNSIYFTKNFDLSQEEGGGDIDMTEVTNAIDTNSNIQVLILFFLISLFVYLIFYTVANSGRRNK